MRRTATYGLLILTAVLFQTTVFAKFKLFEVVPDLVVVLVICFALLEGPTTGAVVGFSAGFLRDLLLTAPTGLTGLAYLIVGYVVGSVRPYVESTSVFVPIAGVFFGSLAASTIYGVLQQLLGQESVPLGRSIQVVVLIAVYNTLLVPFVYPIARKFSRMEGAKSVYRW